MKKNKPLKKLWTFLLWIVGVIVALGVGGLFVGGTFMEAVLLKWLPLVVHQIVGWTVIVATLAGVLFAIIDTLD